MSKLCRSEANSVAMKIKSNKAKWYVADVDLGDDSEDVFACTGIVKKTLGKAECNFMIISAGVKNISVAVQCQNPKDGDEYTTVRNLLEYSVSDISPSEIVKRSDHRDSETGLVGVVLEIDTPFKLKDTVRSSAFKFLRSNGYIKEESEEEEYGFDDF